MRVELEAPTDLVHDLLRYRPCPDCGSGRVTVQRKSGDGEHELRLVRCADCEFALELRAK